MLTTMIMHSITNTVEILLKTKNINYQTPNKYLSLSLFSSLCYTGISSIPSNYSLPIDYLFLLLIPRELPLTPINPVQPNPH